MTLLDNAPRAIIPPADPEWRRWLLRETEALGTPSFLYDADYRRACGEKSPLRFGLIYLSDHLTSSRGEISFSEFHLAALRQAKNWRYPEMSRDAWIAPRGAGKSTMFYLVLPLWALAYGHRKFFLSFAFNAKMAIRQLNTMRRELNTNALLLGDFPNLRPARGKGSTDNAQMVVAGGSTIATSGLGGTVLGVKSGSTRPDLMLGDDLEPNESRYSPDEVEKLLNLLLEGVLPMGDEKTATSFTGTVTMYNSIMHQVVQHARGKEVPWIDTYGFRTNYFPGIVVDPTTGAERSLWPQRWELTPTHLGEHPRWAKDGKVDRAFQLNCLLDPSPADGSRGGGVWREDMIEYDPNFHAVAHALYIDPALKRGRRNDFTAFVVVGRSANGRKAVVEYASQEKLGGEGVRQRILRYAADNPDLRTLIVEENAGGSEHWGAILRPDAPDWPRHLRLHWEWVGGHKHDRIKLAASHYERDEVLHRRPLNALQEQMLLYPDDRQHDDLVDGLAGALRWAFREGKFRNV